jgi:succinoglycan biosynthesis transport protein ExoP
MEANTTDENKGFAPAPESKLHFLDYWRIIRIRKTVILAVFLLVFLTTTVVTLFLPKSYSSIVKLSIEQDIPDVDVKGQFLVKPMADPFFIQTEFQRIQSKPVLYKVIEELNLQEQWGAKYKQPGPLSREKTAELLKNLLHVDQSHNTTLVEIHAYSDNKEEAAAIAQKVADVYAKVRLGARSDLKSNAIVALRQQLSFKEHLITNQLKVVNELRQKLEISDYEANQPTPTLSQETLRQINTALHEAHARSLEASNQYVTFANLSREKLKDAASLTVRDPRLAGLIADENATEQRLADLRGAGLVGEEYPDFKSKTELLKTIRKQLDDALTGVMIGMKSHVDSAEAAVRFYTDYKESLKRQDLTNYAVTRPYYEAKEDLLRLKIERDNLARTVDITEVELNTPSKGMVQIIEPAEPNPRPVRPNIKLNIALGAIIGLLIGLGLAFFIEYLDTSVKTIDDVERALQAPVLGVIPQNVGVLIEEGPDSPHAEAYRVLRTNVLFSRKDPKLNSMTIVSGGAGEGKSTTIFNLATVFAQNGQRVLVVDSDLRRPSLHKYLHVSNAIGLTNYLLKQNTLEEVIQTSAQPNLDFLPSGRLPSSSLGILSSMQMKELIRDVKRRYDFVFFDSPPIMGVSDASILASEVDMVLQVIQYRRYPQPMTIRAKQMIEKVGGNLLGIVLNNINVSQDENYYYYSGYYYDYYTKGEYTDGEKPAKKGGGKPEGKEDAKVEIKSKF